MISDSFFQQGVTHEVCEDYALHGPGYAIISDGCSNGGGPRLHTDWGSRILCKTAEENIDLIDMPDRFMYEIAENAEFVIDHFRTLSIDCLTATLSAVKHTKDGFRIFMMGDGYYGGRMKDGSWCVHQVEYPSGAPFYLQYIIEDNVDTYVEQFGLEYNLISYQSKFPYPPEPIIETKTKLELDLESPYQSAFLSANEFDTAFVASDGLASFHEIIETATNKHTESIKDSQVLDVLFDFVDLGAGFLKRQRNWAFKLKKKGTFVSRNWHAHDDVSVGIVHENS